MLPEEDLKRIQRDLEAYDEAREKIIEASRKAVRLSAWAIIQLHRRDLESALRNIREAEGILENVGQTAEGKPYLTHLGQVLVAYQELSEAKVLHHLVREGKVPSLDDVGSASIPYVLGLLEVTGEIRRMVLEDLRNGKIDGAEALLALMEGIYEDLLSLEHTAVIPNFRRKMDVARKLIEATRADVITDLRRISLERAIKDLERRLQ